LRYARGAPLSAYRAFHEDQGGTFRPMAELLLTLLDGGGDPLEVAEKWRKKGIQIVLSGLLSCAGDMLRLRMGADPVVLAGQEADTFQALAVRLDSSALFHLLDQCLEARRAVIRRSNLNELLLLENLACSWSALSTEATAQHPT